MLYPVGGLLKLSDLSDDVGDLRNTIPLLYQSDICVCICM